MRVIYTAFILLGNYKIIIPNGNSFKHRSTYKVYYKYLLDNFFVVNQTVHEQFIENRFKVSTGTLRRGSCSLWQALEVASGSIPEEVEGGTSSGRARRPPSLRYAPYGRELRPALVKHRHREGVHRRVAHRHQARYVERVQQHRREPETRIEVKTYPISPFGWPDRF